eukprot:647959-Lingulodinium_polyedra.AAC.1
MAALTRERRCSIKRSTTGMNFSGSSCSRSAGRCWRGVPSSTKLSMCWRSRPAGSKKSSLTRWWRP